MHEMTVAANLVDLIDGVVAEQGAEAAVEARLLLGALTCINPDSLRFGFEALSRDTAAAGCELMIDVVPAAAECRECGWRGTIADPLMLTCGGCQGRDLALAEGQELTLKTVAVR